MILTVSQIAEVVHNSLRAYDAVIGEELPLWEDAPEEMKDSIISGINYRINHPHDTAEAQHIEWCRHKKEKGWTYGEVKDPEKKIHPCLVDYSKLPVAQKVKDEIFANLVNILL